MHWQLSYKINALACSASAHYMIWIDVILGFAALSYLQFCPVLSQETENISSTCISVMVY